MTYHSLLCDRHEVLFAEGLPVESFYPGPMALGMLGPEGRTSLFEVMPGLAGGDGYGPTARPVMRCRDAARKLKAIVPASQGFGPPIAA